MRDALKESVRGPWSTLVWVGIPSLPAAGIAAPRPRPTSAESVRILLIECILC